MSRRSSAAIGIALLLTAAAAGSQQTGGKQPSVPPGQQTSSPAPAPPPASSASSGTVLFSRDVSVDSTALPRKSASQTGDAQLPASPDGLAPGDDDPLKVTDAERNALTFTAYNLDVHLVHASAGISVRAGLTVRNDSQAALKRLILQVSSSLRWEAFSAPTPGAATSTALAPLHFTTRRIATDADHTGWAQEAVINLPRPLAPGQAIQLTALYSGAIPQSAERLERIGAPSSQAAGTDWDAIAGGTPLAPDRPEAVGEETALRGFGDVLWYPVASAPVFLGDGAKLFQAVGNTRLRQSGAAVLLRLAVEFAGDAPDAAFFCGRREALTAIRDNPGLASAESSGVATAAFAAQQLGFRSLSLFVTGHSATPAGPVADEGLISAVTDHFDALQSYSAAAGLVEPLLTDWFGKRPDATLNLLDHPGQPFEDDALLVRPVAVQDPAVLARSLVHSLTHVWIHSRHPWIDEGLAQFSALLWTEQTIGRAAALQQLQEEERPLALAEPAPSGAASLGHEPEGPSRSAGGSPPGGNWSNSSPDRSFGSQEPASGGQSLIGASSEVFYRTKAAAVWWMLRGITGDDALKQALQAYRADPGLDLDPDGFQRTLERTSHKDLSWFFESWVDNDRGLPDLSIVNVTPRQLEARNGLPAGWLISVDVRNDGDAVADVPLLVRSAATAGAAAATETQTLRIPGHSNVSRRIVFSGTPDEVQVNDGGVPESGTSIHTRKLVLPSGR